MNPTKKVQREVSQRQSQYSSEPRTKLYIETEESLRTNEKIRTNVTILFSF